MARRQRKKREQKNILFLPRIPSTVTTAHIEKFFGLMVECYMKCNANGQFRECYVYFHESKSALKALEKDNQILEDYRVRVELALPSVTLRSLREKKMSTTLRLVPFSQKTSNSKIEKSVRSSYASVVKVEVRETKCYGQTGKFKYAIISFRDSASAEDAMATHAYLVSNDKTPKVLDDNYDAFFDGCKKQLLLE